MPTHKNDIIREDCECTGDACGPTIFNPVTQVITGDCSTSAGKENRGDI